MSMLLSTRRTLLGGAKIPAFDFNLSALSFTQQMAIRTGPGGVFAGAPIVQGKLDGTGVPDLLSFPVGDVLGNPTGEWFSTFDPHQASIVFFWTPELDRDAALPDEYFIDWGNDLYFRYEHDNALLQLGIEGETSTYSLTIVAGTTYCVIVRWDTNNPIDGTNFACIAVNNSLTFGMTTAPILAGLDEANIYIGSASGGTELPLNGVVEGFTIFRRVLRGPNYGTAVNFDASGPIDELAAIYAAGAGSDPALICGSWGTSICIPTNSTPGQLVADGMAWSHPFSSNLLDQGFCWDGGYLGGDYVVEFDAGDTDIDCGNGATLNDLPNGANGFQVGIWVRPNSWGEANSGHLLSKYVGDLSGGWIFGISDTYGLFGYIYNLTTPAWSASGTDEFSPDGKWHFLLMSFEHSDQGGDCKVYFAVDGVWAADYDVQVAGVGAFQSDAAVNLHIGNSSPAPSHTQDGDVGWSALWNNVTTYPVGTNFVTPRTPPGVGGNLVECWPADDGTGTNVAALINSPANDGTLAYGTWIAAWNQVGTPVVPQSLEFFAENAGINFGSGANIDDLFSADCTLECIARVPVGANEYLISKGNATTNGWYMRCNSGGFAQIIAQFANTDLIVASTIAINDNQKHHIALDWDVGTLTGRVFVDGVLCGTGVAVGAYQTDAAIDCLVNAYNAIGTGDRSFAIGPIRLSNTRRYTGNSFVPPPRTNIASVWALPDVNTVLQANMDDGAGTTVTDSSASGYDGTVTFGATTHWNNSPDLAIDEPGRLKFNTGYNIGMTAVGDGISCRFTGIADTSHVVRPVLEYGVGVEPQILIFDVTGNVPLMTANGPPLVGTHDGGNNVASLTRTGKMFPASLVGSTLYNVTDGSSTTVTSVAGTNQDTVVGVLTGGAENLWDDGDDFMIVPADGWVYAEPFVFQNGSNTDLEIRITNELSFTGDLGVLTVHQVEILESSLANGDMETLSGTPPIPTGWVNVDLDAGDTEAEAVVVHAGAQSLEFAPGAGISETTIYTSGAMADGTFFVMGGWFVGSGVASLHIGTQNVSRGVWHSDPTKNNYDSGDGFPVDAVWLHVCPVWRMGSTANHQLRLFGAAAQAYCDDAYAFALDAVTLTVTPRTYANSLETILGVQYLDIDGFDLCTQPVVNIRANRGQIRFTALPRHDLDNLSFGQAREYLFHLWEDANNNIELYRINGGLVLEVTANGVASAGVWAGTWNAGDAVDVRVQYTGGTVEVRLGGVTYISAPLASFAADPTLAVHWGCDRTGICQFDGLIAGPGGSDSVTSFVPADIPQAEADYLIELFGLTRGSEWTVNTNWLVDTTVGNWFGVTVAGGHVTQVNLDTNNFVGSLATWSPDCLPSLIYLYLNNNAGLIGDISGWVLPNSLVYLRLYNTGVSGDISGWVLPNSLVALQLYSTNLSGTPDISGNTAMRGYYYHNCALTQANVDAVLLSVYNRRMAFTFATPILLIHGTNAAPSGIYQAACPPGTGKEYAFELVNDSCGDGFNKWTVTTS